MPVTTITAKPANIHGNRRRVILVSGTWRSVSPSSRKSSMVDKPTKTHNVRTWTDSTNGYMKNDSWSAMLPGVAASHSQKRNKDIELDFHEKRVSCHVS